MLLCSLCEAVQQRRGEAQAEQTSPERTRPLPAGRGSPGSDSSANAGNNPQEKGPPREKQGIEKRPIFIRDIMPIVEPAGHQPLMHRGAGAGSWWRRLQRPGPASGDAAGDTGAESADCPVRSPPNNAAASACAASPPAHTGGTRGSSLPGLREAAGGSRYGGASLGSSLGPQHLLWAASGAWPHKV